MPLTPFADGPGNTASGVAVYNNDLYLEALANAKEAAFSAWKDLSVFRAGHLIAAGAASYFMLPGGGAMSVIASSAGGAWSAFYFDPADYTAGTRTTQLRVRWTLQTNGVASGINYVGNLWPVSAFAGLSGAQPGINGTGTANATAQTAFSNPALNSSFVTPSGAFTAPTAGFYLLGVTLGGAMAAGSAIAMEAQLQMRQV